MRQQHHPAAVRLRAKEISLSASKTSFLGHRPIVHMTRHARPGLSSSRGQGRQQGRQTPRQERMLQDGRARGRDRSWAAHSMMASVFIHISNPMYRMQVL